MNEPLLRAVRHKWKRGQPQGLGGGPDHAAPRVDGQATNLSEVAPTALVKQPDGKYAVEHFAVLPLHGYWWYASLDVAVLAVSAGLFVIALAVFGRLEGNFAEEL